MSGTSSFTFNDSKSNGKSGSDGFSEKDSVVEVIVVSGNRFFRAVIWIERWIFARSVGSVVDSSCC